MLFHNTTVEMMTYVADHLSDMVHILYCVLYSIKVRLYNKEETFEE